MIPHDSSFETLPPQVNCGNVDSLLQRLVKVSYFGLDFLNTFLMTFPLYTDAHTVMDFLTKSYHDCLEKKDKSRRGSLSPQDAVRDARGREQGENPAISSSFNQEISTTITYDSGSVTPWVFFLYLLLELV